jgi:hypothetical protein
MNIDMTIAEFNSLCDSYTNKSIFKVNKDNELLKDESGNLVKINYDNIL